MNVDVANGVFWTTSMVMYTAREMASCRDLEDLSQRLQPTKDTHGARKESPAFQVLRYFRRLGVTVTHRGQKDEKPPQFIIDKFINQSAKEYRQKFRNKETGQDVEMTVFEYFRRTYNMPLNFPNLPLMKTTKANVVFPMELCKILPDQRYVFKLSESQTAKMIKFAVTPPDQRWRHLSFGVGMLKWDSDPNLKAFGLKIDSKPASIKANILPNPKVQFGSGPHNPGTSGRWDLRGKKFMAGNTKELQSWGIMVVDGRGAPDRATVQRFIGEFVKIYTQHGGKVKNPRPVILPSGANVDGGKMVENLWQQTGNQSNMRPQMLMFVLPFREAKLYNRLKKSCDCRFGVVSQCVQAAHVQVSYSTCLEAR